jgi:hypothetical protein
MEISVIIDVDETTLNKGLVELETELIYYQHQKDLLEKLLVGVVKTQFPQEWFGKRKGMSKDKFIEYLSKTKLDHDGK